VTISADTIATFAPPTAQPPKLYAHGGQPGLRKFLYEQDEPAITIRLRPPADVETRLALDSAVDRINALHRGFSSSSCANNDLVPSDRAAVSAIMSVYEISPRIPAQIFPLPGGGLQLEWHHGQLDIEIECLADGSTFMYLAIDGDKVIDERASGQRVQELLERVREQLAEATSDYRGGPLTIFG
jgi:hypothetical protein